MLVLSRQRDESIMIGNDIEITVVDIRGDKVRLGINAPKNVTIHRKEVFLAIKMKSEAEEKKTESYGYIINPDGSLGETTKAFSRGNHQWCYAEIKVPPHLPFPNDMLHYDGCEVNPGYEPVIDGGTENTRFIVVRRPHTSTRKWTLERWRSFGCAIEVISGKIKSRTDHTDPYVGRGDR
jgi:carbon storage regulator